MIPRFHDVPGFWSWTPAHPGAPLRQIQQERQRILERAGDQPITDRGAGALGLDQPGILQDGQMPGDGGPAHVEQPGDIAGRHRPLAQRGDDLPAGGIGECLESVVHFGKILIWKNPNFKTQGRRDYKIHTESANPITNAWLAWRLHTPARLPMPANRPSAALAHISMDAQRTPAIDALRAAPCCASCCCTSRSTCRRSRACLAGYCPRRCSTSCSAAATTA